MPSLWDDLCTLMLTSLLSSPVIMMKQGLYCFHGCNTGGFTTHGHCGHLRRDHGGVLRQTKLPILSTWICPSIPSAMIMPAANSTRVAAMLLTPSFPDGGSLSTLNIQVSTSSNPGVDLPLSCTKILPGALLLLPSSLGQPSKSNNPLMISFVCHCSHLI